MLLIFVQTMDDFIRGVLMSDEDLMDARIYYHELSPEEYALPATSWCAYHVLSRDLLCRRAYPLVPPSRRFSYQSRNIYKEASASLARGSALHKDSLIGEASTVNKDSSVGSSIVGRRCRIGENARIQNSHLMDNVTVGNNCEIVNCIVLPNVTLEGNTKVNDVILEAPPGGKGKPKHLKLSESLGLSSRSDREENEEDFEEDDEEEDSRCASEGTVSPIPDDASLFFTEVTDSLLRGYQEKLNCENLILEINSSRYAYNVTISEVTENVIKAILSLPVHDLTHNKLPVTSVNYQKTLKKTIDYFAPIVANYVKTEDAQLDCLRAMEESARTIDELRDFVKHLLHLFYDRDILSEEKILQWFYEEDETGDIVRTSVKPFVKWLEEAEEDSDDE